MNKFEELETLRKLYPKGCAVTMIVQEEEIQLLNCQALADGKNDEPSSQE